MCWGKVFRKRKCREGRERGEKSVIIVYFREIVEEWLAFSWMFWRLKITYRSGLKVVRLLCRLLNKLEHSRRHFIFITWMQQGMLGILLVCVPENQQVRDIQALCSLIVCLFVCFSSHMALPGSYSSPASTMNFLKE